MGSDFFCWNDGSDGSDRSNEAYKTYGAYGNTGTTLFPIPIILIIPTPFISATHFLILEAG